MERSLWSGLVYLAVAATMAGAAGAPAVLDIPEIRRYYETYNRVVVSSSPAERAKVFSFVDGISHDKALLEDRKLKALCDSIVELESHELRIDPGILRGPLTHLEFQYEIQPVEILRRTEDTVVIETRRIPHGQVRIVIPAEPGVGDRSRIRDRGTVRPGGWSFTEIHYWLRIEGRWMIDEVHIYPISRS